MITEHMQLTTLTDAAVWAAQFDNCSDAQQARLRDWIWDNRPSLKCTYVDHPLYSLSDEEFWEIVGDD